MKFLNKAVEECNLQRKSQPILVIFVNSEDDADENILEIFFTEALNLAAENKSVYWVRPVPPLKLPKKQQNLVIKPNLLERINLKYDDQDIYSKIVQICTEEICQNPIIPHSLFLELQKTTILGAEFGTILALLAHISKWILIKRSEKDNSFPIVITIKDSIEFRMHASLYSNYLNLWHNVDKFIKVL